jgi:hypothetical protein
MWWPSAVAAVFLYATDHRGWHCVQVSARIAAINDTQELQSANHNADRLLRVVLRDENLRGGWDARAARCRPPWVREGEVIRHV